MKNKIKLKPTFNKKNGQINFSLKKSSFPKKYKDKLPDLKGIEVGLDNCKFAEKEEFLK